MSEYTCPNCRGEFSGEQYRRCPWCGQVMDESYEPDDSPLVSRVERDDGQQMGSMMSKLLGGNNE